MDPQSKYTLTPIINKVTTWIGSPNSMVVHTLVFILALISPLFNLDSSKVLLILTTLVSLEAIYLSIFIQYTVNQHAEALTEVASDIDSVTEEVKEISGDVDDISSGVEELSADVEDISDNLEEHLGEPEPEAKSDDYEMLEKQVTLLLEEVRRLKTTHNNQPQA